MTALSVISQWLHKGENAPLGICRRNWNFLVPILLSLFAPGILLAALLPSQLNIPASLLWLAIAAATFRIYYSRSAIIVTETSILIRPLLGKRKEIPLAYIRSVSSTMVEAGRRSSAGCRLEYLIGGSIDLVGYAKQDRLLSQIRQILAPKI